MIDTSAEQFRHFQAYNKVSSAIPYRAFRFRHYLFLHLHNARAAPCKDKTRLIQYHRPTLQIQLKHPENHVSLPSIQSRPRIPATTLSLPLRCAPSGITRIPARSTGVVIGLQRAIILIRWWTWRRRRRLPPRRHPLSVRLLCCGVGGCRGLLLVLLIRIRRWGEVLLMCWR